VKKCPFSIDTMYARGYLATFATEKEWNLAMQKVGADALLDLGGLWIGIKWIIENYSTHC